MKRNSIEFGKDMPGHEIWTTWLDSMQVRLASCMPEAVMRHAASLKPSMGES